MHDTHHSQPSRKQALVFIGKTKLLQAQRLCSDLVGNVAKHSQGEAAPNWQVVGQSSTPLWTEEHAAERDLTAGKIQNLRVACRALHGVVVPAGEVFSFWKQTGRTTKAKGYVIGRELREGCLIPNLGGGLCQLSNGLYNAAMKAGFKILERHAHSQQVPGSLAAVGRDATVFWNYVDLRFSHQADFRIEARLSKNHLHIRFKSEQAADEVQPVSVPDSKPVEAMGNCFSCNVGGCFRNAPQDEKSIDLGRTAILLDSYAPEFQHWLNENLKPDDRVFCPIDAKRFRAPAYRWQNPTETPFGYATTLTLTRSLRLRFLPSDGGALQCTLMKFDRKLAAYYARKIDYRVTHLIVSQNLLPHLWELGVMGGRTFEVLATRYPLEDIQTRLNEAHAKHSKSPTLNDFRVDSHLCAMENEALNNARCIHTAHQGVAEAMPGEVNILPWVFPDVEKRTRSSSDALKIGFPASPLGKKGIYEFMDALEGINAEVLILGKADEGLEIPNSRQASLAEIMHCDVLVLPAYIEHSPRPLLRALAMGIPVIATKACGLPPQKGLTLLNEPKTDSIREALFELLKTARE